MTNTIPIVAFITTRLITNVVTQGNEVMTWYDDPCPWGQIGCLVRHGHFGEPVVTPSIQIMYDYEVSKNISLRYRWAGVWITNEVSNTTVTNWSEKWVAKKTWERVDVYPGRRAFINITTMGKITNWLHGSTNWISVTNSKQLPLLIR